MSCNASGKKKYQMFKHKLFLQDLRSSVKWQFRLWSNGCCYHAVLQASMNFLQKPAAYIFDAGDICYTGKA